MKIMYIIHSCIMGGATISFLNLVKGIVDQGFEVVVVHPKPLEKDAQLIDRLKEIGCKCSQQKVVSSGISKSKNPLKTVVKFLLFLFPIFINKIFFYFSLNKYVHKEKPDIIHTNTGVVHEGYKIAKKYGIPHIWHLREYQTKDFNIQIIPSMSWFRRALKESYTICITKDIQTYFGLTGYEKSYVIYNPAMSVKNIHLNNNRENFFLVANRLSVEKGISDIIEAFGIFSKQNMGYLLKIAGFGNEKYISILKQRIKELGIEDKVFFLGYTDQVPFLMQNAKALIVASYNEGFGRMSAEANMLGLPVLGRNTSGTKEILDLTKGGMKFNNIEELTLEMSKLSQMENSEITSFMAQPQLKALDLFSSEQHLEKMFEFYKTICRKNNE